LKHLHCDDLHIFRNKICWQSVREKMWYEVLFPWLWNGKIFTTNQYQSISIKLLIAVGNRWQSIKGHKDLHHRLIIDYQYQLINWYWLISIVIDYRFHRLDTPGNNQGLLVKTF